MEKPQPHIADYKKKIVTELVGLLKKYPIIGCINMENLPAAQLQNMRAQLRDKVVMFMTKRRLMKLAIGQAKAEKKEVEKLEQHLVGMPALLFTDENPFSLFRFIKKNKSKAPAKAGQTAPSDIIIPAGPTPFAPGPVIGELGALGIKSKVEEGKIVIQEDAVVCKESEEISAPLASMLMRLGIKPMEVGLDLVAVWEEGVIYPKSVLDIDEEQFLADFSSAAQHAFNLSLELGFITPDNRDVMIGKLFREAKAVALEANFLADAVVEEVIAQAAGQAQALGAEIGPLPEAATKAEEKLAEAAPPAPAEKPAEAAPEEKPAPAEEKGEAAEPEAPKPEEKEAEQKVETEAEKPEAAEEVKAPEEPAEKPEEKEEPAEEKAPEAEKPEAAEEIKAPEEPAKKPEEKEEPAEEKEPAEKPKEEEKPAQQQEPKETPASSDIQTRDQETDEKVADMVKKFKDKKEGKIPSAGDLVDEAEKEE